MQEYPHHYVAEAAASSSGDVSVASPGLETFVSAGPAEFGGPGDKWSPETLLVAALADCFILTFRAIARAAKTEWITLSCSVVGDLDRIDKVTRFTKFRMRALLKVPAGIDPERVTRLMNKAEKSCLITNSLIAEVDFEADVKVPDNSA